MQLLLAIVTLSLAGEFVISMMDGADGGRHLLLFTYLLDLLVCADAVFAIRKFVLKPEATSDTEQTRLHKIERHLDEVILNSTGLRRG